LDELKVLREAVNQLENRLSDCQTNCNKGKTMRHILAHFKRILRELEAINPYQYDGLVMQVLGGF
jgi:hypothetical protein